MDGEFGTKAPKVSLDNKFSKENTEEQQLRYVYVSGIAAFYWKDHTQLNPLLQ